ncbi:MAG: excinuclease ABC subunit UvrA, partial [Deltaproteobacteria bacterium]|nr:excinuclease ABC subunit UvrA [Deltaproteobacteria bacterium]
MIIITGANQNNLKNLDLNLPLNSITVVTGVSGSGKSSLAFDTVYAEGQRRYIESFSTYARQFMDRMDKPEVKNIQGILPSIAINQTNTVKTSRSTLGTLTEINDYVKLLFPRLATLHCRTCNKPVEKDTPDSIAEKLLEQCPAERCVLTFPLQIPESSNISIAEIETGLRGQGFFRVYHQDAFSELSPELIEAHRGDSIVLLADRLAVTPENRKRMIDSLESAMKFGKGQVSIFFPDSPQRILKFSSALHCPQCDITYTKPCPNLFSFNSPLGACETCNGFGKTIEVDLDAAIPDHSLSLKNDAVKPWSTPAYRDAYREMLSFCKQNGIPVDKPFEQLNKAEQDAVIYGTDGFFGIMGFFDWLETKTYKMHIRVLLSKYRAYRTCTSCQGTRFKPDSLLFRINGTTITDFYGMNITAADRFMAGIQKNAGGDETVDVLLGEITGRLSYLERVGLGYLSLDRQSRTLSGGEVERASLTTALGSSLVNTLYVLDEPSIGLHPRDTSRLIDILQGLRDLGNTILVVEHDPDIIMQSDRVIDLGPGSGAQGGQIVFSGSPQQMLTDSASLTGQYLSGRLSIPLPRSKRTGDPHSHITITNADKHNLKDLNLTIPLGLLVCITGVSGSGKSTLLEDILYDQLSGKPGRNTTCRLGGMHAPDHVLLMDQSPVGKTPRSNPVTYIKAFGTIRQLFAQAELAQERGYTASTFSFNSSGGRCEHCQGDGYEKIEMQFLADIYVTCSSCQGTRYSPEVLDITYQDCNINDVLNMTITEAGQFFKDIPKIEYPLRLLQMVGLGYLQLGQAANTLSGGESQRLKIAAFIQQGSSRKNLFLFDEPTTGLHFDDIKNLLQTFDFLLKQGHSIVVVEHNLEVIKCADHLVDMGPEGGDLGGTVVFTGTPEAIIEHPASYTGAYLKQYLKPSGTTHPMPERPAAPAPENDTIVIEGAREHNLKNISLTIPREKMVVITGLSGSGKSTLAFDILFAEGQRRFLETLSPYARQYIHQLSRPAVDALRGLPPTVAIEQFLSHGGRKSTVATATEIYHYLRLLYAKAGNQVCP